MACQWACVSVCLSVRGCEKCQTRIWLWIRLYVYGFLILLLLSLPGFRWSSFILQIMMTLATTTTTTSPTPTPITASTTVTLMTSGHNFNGCLQRWKVQTTATTTSARQCNYYTQTCTFRAFVLAWTFANGQRNDGFVWSWTSRNIWSLIWNLTSIDDDWASYYETIDTGNGVSGIIYLIEHFEWEILWVRWIKILRRFSMIQLNYTRTCRSDLSTWCFLDQVLWSWS